MFVQMSCPRRSVSPSPGILTASQMGHQVGAYSSSSLRVTPTEPQESRVGPGPVSGSPVQACHLTQSCLTMTQPRPEMLPDYSRKEASDWEGRKDSGAAGLVAW